MVAATNALRERMVQRQIVSRGISDERIVDAMRAVPREEFVPDDLTEFAYEDTPLPIAEGQTISQPLIVALMIEALEVRPGDKALEIGAGSGYAAAVLGRVAGEVVAVERLDSLAETARLRMERLGYENVHVVSGDGTLGWPARAPYDVILVSAGGPEVPTSLLKQLAIGGRLVIPVGSEFRSQELLRIRRTGERQYKQESLGAVSFVPLIGTEGWAMDGVPVAPRRPSSPVRLAPRKGAELSALIADNAEPFADIASANLSTLIERIGDARVVLIGEATHGTSEFYRMRARITQELIRRKGFTVVGIEGDWPDTRTIDRQVRGQTNPSSAMDGLREPPFSRFPTWMWRNHEMRDFTRWLGDHNKGLQPELQVSIHGLDLYSLNNSIGAVLDYLQHVDPVAAESARVRYGCFSPWEMDPSTYGRAAVSGRMHACEREAVQVLTDLLKQRMNYLANDGEEFFDAERNAAIIREAERYYRTMYYGSRESWNLRDTHMFQTLEAVLEHRGHGSSKAKAVVWAHNSHVGNAAATEMGARGELNIGQLAKDRFGQGAYTIGFGTDHGTVAAASNWDEPMEVMTVRPSHPDSYERLCHDSKVAAFLLQLRSPVHEELRTGLLTPHLERAIGVVYRPDTEIVSHYFQASLPAQFDEYIWFDQTTPVRPIPTRETAGVPETYPFGM